MSARGSDRQRNLVRLTVAATLAAAVIAVGACSSEDSSTKSTTTAKGSPATSTPVPSTVNDADFEQQAATAEAMIANAGKDPCNVVKAFGPASALPTPTNATQTERGVRVVAGLFDSAAASAPAQAAGDAAVLHQAAADLIAEGQAAGWKPDWLMKNPKTITDPKVTQAFTNYQSAVAASCGGGTTTSTP